MRSLECRSTDGSGCSGKGTPSKTRGSQNVPSAIRDQGCGQSIRDFWDQNNLNPDAEFYTDSDDVWWCYQCGKDYAGEHYSNT